MNFKYIGGTDDTYFTLNKTYEVTKEYPNGDIEFVNNQGDEHIWSKSLIPECWEKIKN